MDASKAVFFVSSLALCSFFILSIYFCIIQCSINCDKTEMDRIKNDNKLKKKIKRNSIELEMVNSKGQKGHGQKRRNGSLSVSSKSSPKERKDHYQSMVQTNEPATIQAKVPNRLHPAGAPKYFSKRGKGNKQKRGLTGRRNCSFRTTTTTDITTCTISSTSYRSDLEQNEDSTDVFVQDTSSYPASVYNATNRWIHSYRYGLSRYGKSISRKKFI